MTDPNLTHIAIVLDRSGSMEPVRDATISGFNEFVAAQRKAITGRAEMTLVQFAYTVRTTYSFSPLSEIRPLSHADYEPDGGTALYDAIGETIDKLGKNLAVQPEDLRPGKVIILVLTDGYENSSKRFNVEKVRAMVEHQQSKYGWQFIFMGANQDAILSAKQFGIHAAGAMTYTASVRGTQCAFETASNNVALYANTGDAVSFSAEDRAANANP